MPEGTLVKGATFNSGVTLLAERHGPSSVDTVLNHVVGPVGERLRTQSLLASTWYPIAWQNDLFDALRVALGFKPSDMREFGYRMAMQDFRGLYRIFLKLLTPHFLVTTVPRVTGQYYRGGSVVVTEAGSDHATVTYSDWHGFNEFTWMAILGGSVAGLEATHAKDVRARVAEGGTGPTARLVYTWK